MSALLRIVIKEFAEMILNPRALFVMFLVPPLILVLVGRLQIQPPEARLLVTGLESCEADKVPATDAPGENQQNDQSTYEVRGEDEIYLESIEDDKSAMETYRYLQELSWVDLSCETKVETEPLKRLNTAGQDLILNITGNHWVIFVDDTNPRRMKWHLQLAQGIQVARREFNDDDELTTMLYKLSSLGAIPLQSAFLFYPQSVKRPLALLPGTFGLILCFLPFVITAPSLIRERDGHTLEVLLSAPGIEGKTIMFGKCAAAVLIGMVSAIVMLLTIQIAYHVYIKADAFLFGLFLILPALSAALMGMIVSALARTQTQTLLIAAVYFLGLLLLSGFMYPLEGSAKLIQSVSHIFAFTHIVDPLNAWMFGGDFKRGLGESVLVLSIQCVAYGLLALLAWRWQRKRI